MSQTQAEMWQQLWRDPEKERVSAREYHYDLDVAPASGTTRYPLFRAQFNLDVVRFFLIPFAAWTAHATNYWRLGLDLYDYEGSYLRALPMSEKEPFLDLDTRSLTVGRSLRFPTLGFVNEKVQKGQHVYVRVVENGTPGSNLKARVQTDVIVGRV